MPPKHTSETPVAKSGGEEYPFDCRSYDEYFVPCTAGPAAVANICGLAPDSNTAGNLMEFARWGSRVRVWRAADFFRVARRQAGHHGVRFAKVWVESSIVCEKCKLAHW